MRLTAPGLRCRICPVMDRLQFGSPDEMIVVPGGGLRADGGLPPWTCRRLDRALAYGKEGCFLVTSGGTTYKPPPLDAAGFPIFEAAAAAEYLIAAGVEPDRIFIETSSYDTIGNAFFSRLLHVEPGGFRNLRIITSAFHMPRTRRIFEWIYALDGGAQRYRLAFEETPDDGMDPATLRARRDKERASLVNLEPQIRSLTSMQALHRWLFTQHQAYCAAPVRSSLPDEVLKTY